MEKKYYFIHTDANEDQVKTPFIKAIIQGLSDIAKGNTMTLTEAKKRLGIR